MLEVLGALATNVVGEAFGGGYASLGHHLHGPMWPATLAAIRSFVVDVWGAGRHMQPGEDVLIGIPRAIRGDAHAGVDGGCASECPAAAAVALVVDPQNLLLALWPLQLC